MQKKLIALAVAGLASTAAVAQTNVTIYGVVDLGYTYSTGERPGNGNKAANSAGIDSGLTAGSRIGFKGEEALGNGLKTIFTLEYYIAPDLNSGVGSGPTSAVGASGSASRQTFVGLSHNKLGTVTLGRQYAAGYFPGVRNDAFSGSAIGALAVANGAALSSIGAGSGSRLNNSIAYTSPNWSGFTVATGYSFGEAGLTGGTPSTSGDGISRGNNGVFFAGLNYANGPLNLDAVYQTRQGVTTSLNAGSAAIAGVLPVVEAHVATQDSVNEWILGGSYDFKVAKVFATYQSQDDNNGTSATEISNDVWSLGVSVPVFGNGKIMGSFARVDWDRSGSNGNSDVWALGYEHALSKRTALYTSYTYTDNDKDVVNAAGLSSATRFRGESNYAITAGIRHSF
ncbi:MAG: porin [Rhodocyclaceae bacterium]|nr:porin [Rhodocyclaceae bacterium]